jgi:hypothetical protein
MLKFDEKTANDNADELMLYIGVFAFAGLMAILVVIFV